MNAEIEIISSGEGASTQVLLNGVDISEMVSEVRFQQAGGRLPAVQFTFMADVVHIRSCATVKYPPELYRAIMTTSKGRPSCGRSSLRE